MAKTFTSITRKLSKIYPTKYVSLCINYDVFHTDEKVEKTYNLYIADTYNRQHMAKEQLLVDANKLMEGRG